MMNRLWKSVMRMNAKALCGLNILICLGICGWCWTKITTPPEPFEEDAEATVKGHGELALDTLQYVSNQLSTADVTIPVDPFRPTIEAIFTNETERAAFLKALRDARNAKAGVVADPAAGAGAVGVDGKPMTPAEAAAAKAAAEAAAAKKAQDPFAALRKKSLIPGQTTGPNGQRMVVPKISFLGFIERPDGTRAALFSDSSTGSTFFYEPGKKVHGVTIENATVKSARIRFPDGTSRDLGIGGSVALAAEPVAGKPRPKAAKPGVKKNAKPGAKQPGAKRRAPAQRGKKK